MTITTVDASELEGLTREQILGRCREAGLAATAWKRGRMIAVLTGAEPAPEPKGRRNGEPNALAAQLERRSAEAAGDEVVAKAQAQMRLRTGACQSVTCAIGCQAYEDGAKDAFHWQLCTCGHTQWAHAKAEA